MRHVPNCPRGLTRGQAIRELRKLYNLTQKEIADCVGVSSSLVSKWECGKLVYSGWPRDWRPFVVDYKCWEKLLELYPVLEDMDVTR